MSFSTSTQPGVITTNGVFVVNGPHINFIPGKGQTLNRSWLKESQRKEVQRKEMQRATTLMKNFQNSPDSQNSQNSQSPQDLPNSQTPQDFPNSQTPQDLPNSQTPQDLPNSQTPQDLPNSQTPQDLPLYCIINGKKYKPCLESQQITNLDILRRELSQDSPSQVRYFTNNDKTYHKSFKRVLRLLGYLWDKENNIVFYAGSVFNPNVPRVESVMPRLRYWYTKIRSRIDAPYIYHEDMVELAKCFKEGNKLLNPPTKWSKESEKKTVLGRLLKCPVVFWTTAKSHKEVICQIKKIMFVEGVKASKVMGVI